MKTPWQRADATGNEHAHQSALFQWAAMAAWGGLACADDPFSYSKPGHARAKYAVEPIEALKWLHAIHNQGHGDAIRGNRAKAEGVRKGVPDIFLPVAVVSKKRYGFNSDILSGSYGAVVGWQSQNQGELIINHAWHGLYIELKRPDSVGKKSGNTSDVQNVWIEQLRVSGYAVEVCVGWLEARACIIKYLGLE